MEMRLFIINKIIIFNLFNKFNIKYEIVRVLYKVKLTVLKRILFQLILFIITIYKYIKINISITHIQSILKIIIHLN